MMRSRWGNVFRNQTKANKGYQQGTQTQYMWPNSSNRWEVWDDLELLPVANTDWMKTHFGNHFTQEHSLM